MRRTIPFTVALVVAVAAVLAVMVGVGIGQPTGSHGGTPSDVFTSTEPGRCPPGKIRPDGATVMPTDVTVAQESHLVLSFMAQMWELAVNEEGAVGLAVLDDAGDPFVSTGFDWYFMGNWVGQASQTVTWTFDNVPAGDYTVVAPVRVQRWSKDYEVIPGKGNAALSACSLTVLVVPAAQ